MSRSYKYLSLCFLSLSFVFICRGSDDWEKTLQQVEIEIILQGGTISIPQQWEQFSENFKKDIIQACKSLMKNPNLLNAIDKNNKEKVLSILAYGCFSDGCSCKKNDIEIDGFSLKEAQARPGSSSERASRVMSGSR